MGTMGAAARLWTVLRTLGRHDALVPHEFAMDVPASLRLVRFFFSARTKDPLGVRLAAALKELGPTAVKLGQLLATRPDIVGADVATHLAELQDRLAPFPTEQAKSVIAGEFGKPVEEIFAGFEDPVAAASIAQVHCATSCADPAKKFAVKVLRPDIAVAMQRDLKALALMAAFAEKHFAEARRLRLSAVVKTLAVSVELELDLRMEAAAMDEYGEQLTNPAFRVPKVDWAHTGARVITMEWIDGVPLRDIAGIRRAGHDPKDVARRIAQQTLRSALCDGYFHADMHPGNLFIENNGTIVFVDFGIMGRVDAAARRFMAEVLMGFLSHDFRRAARAHFAYGTVPAEYDEEVFAQALRAIVAPIFGRPVHEISMAQLLQQLFDTTRRFGMQTQPQLLLLQKTMVVVEGVARSLDPDFDMWQTAKPVVKDWLTAHAGPEARLREAGNVLRGLAGMVRNWAAEHADAG